MKILLLAPAGGYHMDKWVYGLSTFNELEIKIVSLQRTSPTVYNELPNVSCVDFDFEASFVATWQGKFRKLKYLTVISKLKRIIKEYNPDIIHSHYLSSYGLLGALVGRKPYMVSVWGSDIYDFPKISVLHKWLIKYTLRKSDAILSTSNCMAKEISKYTNKPIKITPFGVDINKFKPMSTAAKTENLFIIGTVKSLHPKYGIDTLINAFNILIGKLPEMNIELHIAGQGVAEAELKALANSLKLSHKIKFLGYVDNNKVPELINSFDIFAALSKLDSESFGVAAVEAMACEVPVVVSDVDGFKEVVPHDCGIIVHRDNPQQAADELYKLILNKAERDSIRINGRKNVLIKYDFRENLKTMMSIYNQIYDDFKKY